MIEQHAGDVTQFAPLSPVPCDFYYCVLMHTSEVFCYGCTAWAMEWTGTGTRAWAWARVRVRVRDRQLIKRIKRDGEEKVGVSRR